MEKKFVPMPKLETGMFGKTSTDDMFVVVNEKLLYQSGGWDKVSDFDPETGICDDYCHITELYAKDTNCFDSMRFKNPIWKCETPLVSDREVELFFSMLEKLLDELKGEK